MGRAAHWLRLKPLALRAWNALLKSGVPCTRPEIRRILPHDPRAFTQGLVYGEGQLFESTGTADRSSLRRLDLHTGAVSQLVPVVGDFAEGIAILGGRLFQLSWTSGRARVYELSGLRLIDEIRYEGEGWGLASDGTRLIVSDGSSVLRFCDDRLQTVRELPVRSNYVPVRKLNDLTWADGTILANVLGEPAILEIGAADGKVRRLIDCTELVERARPRDSASVLNGIAHNPDGHTFFATGKNWSALFEIAIPPR